MNLKGRDHLYLIVIFQYLTLILQRFTLLQPANLNTSLLYVEAATGSEAMCAPIAKSS